MRAQHSYLSRLLSAGVTIALATGLFQGMARPAGAAALPTFAVGSVAIVEGDLGNHVAYFPVTLSDPATVQVSIDYVIDDITASASTGDYKQKTGTLTFKPAIRTGLTAVRKFVAVTVFGDTRAEGDETLSITLSNPTGGAAVGNVAGVATIIDDDPDSQLRIDVGDVSIYEGDSAISRAANMTVTLSHESASPVSVDYVVSAGTAIDGIDFKARIGTLIFNPRQIRKTVAVSVYADTVFEGDETAILTLSAATGAIVNRDIGTLTILNDDVSAAPLTTLWSDGDNSFGALGLGDLVDRTAPTQVGVGTDWKTAEGGNKFTVALKTDGAMWSWGSNNVGQLGLGNTTIRTSPTRIGIGSDWSKIATGSFHAVAIKTDGTLWSWGLNTNGDLCFPPSGESDTGILNPTQVGVATDWKAVSTGRYYTVLLKNDGSLWVCGDNPNGQLGTGDTASRTTPTRIGVATDWAKIAAGGSHTSAIKTDGTLWGWGDNFFGELGLGDAVNRLTPTKVGVATDWTSVAVGYEHTVGIKAAGELWTWGRNPWGELGTGDTTNRSTPTHIGTASWAQIDAGYDYTLAIMSTGTLWAWGANFAGALGTGDTTSRNTPTQIGAATDWSDVAAGEGHSILRRG